MPAGTPQPPIEDARLQEVRARASRQRQECEQYRALARQMREEARITRERALAMMRVNGERYARARAKGRLIE